LLVAVFVGSFMDRALPLTPLQILWINLVTNGLPALALGVDPPDPTQMMEPPRKSTSGLLTSREYLGMALVGLWMGASALACYLWPWPSTTPLDDAPRARALAFSLLALSPLFHAFSCRSTTRSIFSLRPIVSEPLVAGLLASAGIHMVAILVPMLRPVFRTFSITGYEWGVMLALAVSIVPAMEVLKYLQRARIIGSDLGPMSRRAP
jgi:Ca2+-transporting ATPase